jgi:hypothetical protein
MHIMVLEQLFKQLFVQNLMYGWLWHGALQS